MSPVWMKALVPRCWTGEEALLAVRLLRQATDAVWEVHGEDMVALLVEVPAFRDHATDYLQTDEDDFPF